MLTSQAEPTLQKHAPQTPAALREGGLGERTLLSEKRPLPQKLSYCSLGGSAREGASRQRSPLPRKTFIFLMSIGRGGSVSRRDHNQDDRRHAQLAGGTNSAEARTPQRQPLFGRSGLSPRNSATVLWEGARGRGPLDREAPPSQNFISSHGQSGRGGSVSRRDHNQDDRRHAQLAGGTNSTERMYPKRQPLFGRGVLGERRFSQRSGLSPRNSPLLSSRGGSAREGASRQRSPLPRGN